MQARWLALIALLLLITIKEPVMAQNLTVSEVMRSEIAALVTAEESAWNRASADSFAERALPDIVFTNIFGMFSVGKAPFVAQHERIFSSIYKGSTNRLRIEHITFVKPDVAIVDILTVGDGGAAPAAGRPVHRRCITLAARTGLGAAGGRLVGGVIS